MGSKSSHFYQADRPESGGADRKQIKEESGLHDRDKGKLESQRAQEREDFIPERGENPAQARARGAEDQGRDEGRAEQRDEERDQGPFQGSE